MEVGHGIGENLRCRSRFGICLADLLDGPDAVEYLFNGLQADLGLGHVRAVEAIDAVRAENTLLQLENATFLVPFTDEVAKFLLDGIDLIHQIIELVELVAAGLGMKVKPDVFDILLDDLVGINIGMEEAIRLIYRIDIGKVVIVLGL